MLINRYLIILVGALLIMSLSAVMCAAEETNHTASLAVKAEKAVNSSMTEAQAITADLEGFRIVNGIAILPILPGNDSVVQSLLSSLAKDPDFKDVNMLLYAPVGTKPKILVSTNQDETSLRYAVQKLKTIMNKMGQPHRLVVSAYLRAITMNNNDFAGLSLFANGAQIGLTSDLLTTITRTWGEDGTIVIKKTTPNYTAGLIYPVNIVANLNKTLSNGKVIVGSELTIPNGTTAELKNDNSTPVPLSSYGNVTFNTQTISSDIKITPTIVQFNPEKPEESIVRLEISIQLSIPTNTVNFGTSSASQYVTQTLTSTHYVKANNEKFIGGLFASDVWMQSKSGIPVLMSIPVLQHLFTSKKVTLQHLASILFMSVRILPVDKEDGYDW